MAQDELCLDGITRGQEKSVCLAVVGELLCASWLGQGRMVLSRSSPGSPVSACWVRQLLTLRCRRLRLYWWVPLLLLVALPVLTEVFWCSVVGGVYVQDCCVSWRINPPVMTWCLWSVPASSEPQSQPIPAAILPSSVWQLVLPQVPHGCNYMIDSQFDFLLLLL